jgi:chorismate dehydratase
MKFLGELGSYEEELTEDGTQTLHSSFFNESCHSSSGAQEETRVNYLEGCQVLKKAQQAPHLCLFEVGFGLGLGVKATFEALEKAQVQTPVTFISTELDPALIKYAQERTPLQAPSFPDWDQLELQGDFYLAQKGPHRLIILLGNARQSIKRLSQLKPPPFQAIYQDAFSPKRNPALWTYEWFCELKKYSAKDVILSTYSSSGRIRLALLEAGFLVYKAPAFGPKRQSTRASLQPIEQNCLTLYQKIDQTLSSLRDCDLENPESEYFYPDYLSNGIPSPAQLK